MSPVLPTTSKMFSILFVSCLETQLIEMLTLPSCGLTLIFIVEICDCVGWLACILLLLQWRGWGETSYCWDSLQITHCLSNTRFTRNSANFKSSDRVHFNHKIFPRVLSDCELLKYYQAETSFNMTRPRSASTSLKLETDEDIKAEDLEV